MAGRPTNAERLDDLSGKIDDILAQIANLNTRPASPPPQPIHTAFPKPHMKLDVPRFDGTDAMGWIFKISQFFDFHRTQEEERITIASFYMDGPALSWYQWMHRNGLITSWFGLLQALETRFAPSYYDDPSGALFKLSQRGSLNTYLNEFERLANQIVGLPPSFILSCFISGLSPEIRREVQALRPVNLSQATTLAKLQEDKINERRRNFKGKPVSFNIGEYVYVKLRPYRQQTIAGRSYTKLSKRYYGPFKILAQFGPVAYKLELPSSSKIHPVFHCSLLKPHHGPIPSHHDPFPPLALDNNPVIEPLSILDSKLDSSTSPPERLVLVQWVGLAPEDTSWEKRDDLCHNYHLEDKVSLRDSGIVINNNSTAQSKTREEGPSATANKGRTKRLTKQPAYLQDYEKK